MQRPPAWGKRHGLTSSTLAERYPRFGEFLAVRDRLDPGGPSPATTPPLPGP
jgi:hypothetical protein